MNKQLLLMVGPLSSRSGYGDHARDIFHAFHELDRFDIKVGDVNWGDTPRDSLNPDNVKDKLILDSMLTGDKNLDRQPDVYVDVRIPNEFETHGKFNIGITAGIETTAVSPKWIEGCNKMDLVIVPSEHSKKSFVDTSYDKVRKSPNGQEVKDGVLTLQKPMEVLFEGCDLEAFKKISYDDIDKSIIDIMGGIKEDNCFLFVGLWGHQPFGEDRKDVGRLVRTFYQTFANKKNKPSLILKTNGATFSIIDREGILKRIREIKKQFPSTMDLPNIHLLHGDLTRSELNSLYNHPKVKAMVSFTHGEGFGRPLLEATVSGLPVISSGWSGQLDFLSKEHSVLIPGTLNNIPDSAVWDDILIKESKWFTVDENSASDSLEFSLKEKFELKRKAESLMNVNRSKFNFTGMVDLLRDIVEKYVPKNMGLNLPTLKPISNKKKLEIPKPKKLKLPTLEKING